MQFKHASAEFVLKENHPLAAVHARGVCIRCTEGRIWITVSGQAEDIFLDAGESWICDGDGLLLIDALDRAQVVIEAPRLKRGNSSCRHFAGSSPGYARLDDCIGPAPPDAAATPPKRRGPVPLAADFRV